MKIVHVVDSMEMGGAETLVMQMCCLQRELGHEPSVYAIAALGPLGEQMRTEGFVVQPDMGRRLPDTMRSFYRIFKGSNHDVVHLHNPTPTFCAAMAARMAGVASIVSTRHSLVAAPRELTRELKFALAATCCDWLVGICDATADNMKSVHGALARKIVRVYNGAEPLQRVPQDQCPPKEGFTLVYVGRLAPVKNHALLFKAFRTALSYLPSLRLWMVGDGGERKKLESLAAKLGIATQVTFWGQQLDVAPFFSAADAFVMSSKSEGLPISLLQAFSLGLPAIVTDVGGMAEVVRLSNAGYLVSAANPAEMATTILRLAGNNADHAQFSKNAIATFNTHFTLPSMVDAYMDLYQKTPRANRASKARFLTD